MSVSFRAVETELTYTLQKVVGCTYSLAALLALGLAVFAAAKLRRSIGAWVLAAGLAGVTLVSVAGDVTVFAEVDLEVSRIIWLAISSIALLSALVMLAGVALLAPPKPDGA